MKNEIGMTEEDVGIDQEAVSDAKVSIAHPQRRQRLCRPLIPAAFARRVGISRIDRQWGVQPLEGMGDYVLTPHPFR
ncbi:MULTISPECIES: hypothetical protein [unclassified Bradyrhizobium]|uniref:hypothetical protein n=1 Tax=unclassified Bradyrhizobium TaxID=2631580 RepID=UPI00230355CB|nr:MULTISPECIES: hypothetical protein [unclassified Bradyrhizobium]